MPLEEKENEILARIQSPGKYDPDSFRRKPFPPNNPERGVFAIYGCPKGEFKAGRCQVGVQVQSFRFTKDAGWTLAKARAWLKAHDFTVTAGLQTGGLISRDTILACMAVHGDHYVPHIDINRQSLNIRYLASIIAEADGDYGAGHYARIYLIDTSVCGNNWEVTDEALERAAKTLIGKPLMIGHGAPEGSAIGTFVDCLKPDGQLYGLAMITDEDAWKRIEAGEWGATSVEFVANKIKCSVCGADLIKGPCEHILNRTGHEVIEDFVFETVGLVEHPAYPRAKVEEVDGIGEVWPNKTLVKERPLPKFPNAHDHTIHAENYTHHNETGTLTDDTGTSTYWPFDYPYFYPTDNPWTDFSRRLTAELEKPRQKGQPRPDRQRLIEHFGEGTALKLLDLVGDDAYKLLPERGTRLHDQPVKTVESKQKGGNKVTEEKQAIRIAELEEQVKTLTQERDELKAGKEITELTAERDELKTKLDDVLKAQHEAKVAELLGLREKAGLVKKADLKAEGERMGKLPDAAIDAFIEDAKQFEPTETSTPRPKIRAGEQLSEMEATRKRLFGHTRDKMASDGGKIIR